MINNKDKLIGILVFNKDKKSLNIYQLYTDNNKATLFAFSPKDINWKYKKIRGVSLISNNKVVTKTYPFPDVIYNTRYGTSKRFIKKLEKVIGKNKCFNHVTKFNKWVIYKILSRTELKEYLPETFLYEKKNLENLLLKYKNLYLKPCYGNRGKKVYKIELDNDESLKLYYHTVKPKLKLASKLDLENEIRKITGNGTFIVQEEIPMMKYNGSYFDIRILVQKNFTGAWAITNMICRITNKFFLNTSLYDKVESFETVLKQLPLSISEKNFLISNVSEISLKVALYLENNLGHLGEISVDYGINKEGFLKIIEVNSSPQKKIYNYLKNTGLKADVYSKPIEYSLYLLNENNPDNLSISGR